MAQQMSGTDFLIRMPSLGIYITTDESLNSMPITLPREIAARLAEGESYAGVTDLGVYEEPRFVVVVPARTADNGTTVGPVLAIAEPNAMTEMWRFRRHDLHDRAAHRLRGHRHHRHAADQAHPGHGRRRPPVR